jgi:hypothetical protein
MAETGDPAEIKLIIGIENQSDSYFDCPRCRPLCRMIAAQWLMEANMDERDAYGVAEFCQRHSISKWFLYDAWRRGRGPRFMWAGDRRIISREAAAEWRKDCEEWAKARTLRGFTDEFAAAPREKPPDAKRDKRSAAQREAASAA